MSHGSTSDRTVKIDGFSFVRHVRNLYELCGKLHATRFREKRPIGPIFVEFQCGGKWYRTEVTNESTCREVIGQLWLISHAEKCAHKNQVRCSKRAAFVEHLKSASRTVKTWPKWKQGLLG